uniref:SET domain-containing protein 9 n=1 Tax=Noccaea caerulescens TaxID=107243 RepID=A0A1J3ICK4_NOCCA
MASLFNKFQQAVGVLAKSTTFAKNPRQLQFEADINKLFMYTSYNRLGREAVETDAEEIIEMAGKATLSEQQKQVQENIHYQVENLCSLMDKILLPHLSKNESTSQSTNPPPPRQSGLTFAVGGNNAFPAADKPLVPETKPLKLADVSQRLMDQIGYTLEIKPSVIPHKDAGQGCFIKGEADVGTVLAFYPGVIYSPAFYRYIPGYPKVDAQNSYLITRYDGTVINAQPWGLGGESREVWTGSYNTPSAVKRDDNLTGSDRLWKALSKPLQGSGKAKEVLERRNPLAFGHLANHPAKEMTPNVMICPYDFPLVEKDLRTYIPNVSFGDSGQVKMKRFGSFWFKTGSNNGLDAPVLKTLVLVATRALCDEELLLNYRLSNSKRRPDWYTPVNEEEDRRRWS